MSVVRRSLQVFAFLCTLVVGMASLGVIVTQTAWFRDWLRGFIVRQADDYVNGRLSIGQIDGNLFYGVRLRGVTITTGEGRVVDIGEVGVRYRAFDLLRGPIVIDDLEIGRPNVHLIHDAGGWNLARLIKLPGKRGSSGGRTLRIREIRIVDGTLQLTERAGGPRAFVWPRRLVGINLAVGLVNAPDDLSVDIRRAALRAVEPDLGIRSLTGLVHRRKGETSFERMVLRTDRNALDFNLVLHTSTPVTTYTIAAASPGFALQEIAPLVPALASYPLTPAFDLTADGPMDRLKMRVTSREPSVGGVEGDLTVNFAAPAKYVAGTVVVRRLDLAPLFPVKRTQPGGGIAITPNAAVRSDLNGTAQIDLTFPSAGRPLRGTYNVRASSVRVAGYQAANVVGSGRVDGSRVEVTASAEAYGGRATTRGTILAASPVGLDLEGHASGVDLRNLPATLQVPPAPSDLDVDYAFTMVRGVVAGHVTFGPSTVAGATIAPGSVGSFEFGNGAPTYAARGNATGLDLQQIGQGFGIGVLEVPRYRSQLNGQFDVTGAGGGRYPLTIEATASLHESTALGITLPQMEVATTLENGDARIVSKGRFENLDPAVVAENEKLTGRLTGTVDAVTTLRQYSSGVTIDSIDVKGLVMLEPSTLAGVAFESAAVDADYSQRAGEIRRFQVKGVDVNASATGPFSLTDTGFTNLVVHAESSSLAQLGKMVDQDLAGSGLLDASISGNAKALTVIGSFAGSDLAYGTNTALSLSSDFQATVPDLTVERVVATASSRGTFVIIGGQTVTELVADTTYTMDTGLDFAARAQEGTREVEAAGRVIFHPDHQEIHLPRLAFRAEQSTWQTPEKSQATVQYSKDRVEIENLALVNGDQRIGASGALGSSTEPLKVTVENVDVAELDRLMLGDQRLAGRLSADGTVSGPLSSPRAEGQFTLTQGAFRTYKYESLTGKVGYVKEGVDVDVRLQGTPTEWLAVKGYAPMTLFKPNPRGVSGGHQEPAPGEAIDLEVSSSEINLGFVQGFTAAITDVTGVMQANVKVTGSGYDPHLEGVVDVRGGSFSVPELGTTYTGLDTKVNLNAEGVSIEQFKILDKRGATMTVGGTLAMHARSVGAVDVSMESTKFDVIDNALANLRLNTDIHITGELRKPKVEGFVEVESGTVYLTEVLERFGSNAYATEASTIPGLESAPAAPAGREPSTPAPAQASTPGSTPPPAAALDPALAAMSPEETQPSVFDSLDMNLALSVPSNLVVRGNGLTAPGSPVSLGDVNLTVGGVLQIGKPPSRPVRLVGDVNTIRGIYTFQGRRFDILRNGRIGFSGGEELDPLLDVQARRVISGIETLIRVRGTMRRPDLSFTSSPPLEQADILSLIIFNQPINELGEGQQVSLAQRAAGLASGYLTSGLARSIGNALRLDEFEIQAQGEEGSGPSLTVGEQVGRNLFFRVRQAFGSEQTTELILEYQIADYLRLQASAAEGSVTSQRVQFRRVERGGLDLIFFFSY